MVMERPIARLPAVHRRMAGASLFDATSRRPRCTSGALSTDIPLVTDFDGDGKTDLVVYRPSDGGWYVRYSSLGYDLNRGATPSGDFLLTSRWRPTSTATAGQTWSSIAPRTAVGTFATPR